ncbi:hypothetical protein SAMN05877753_111154 [Bacillus oleivorans]|uniref:Uncharacterized protein n=1 Tax=Bacillus oleivorans TaxID=1448271 RepID=A0A285D6B4_9BACI|nr:hypothetical protein [Bacillus oleivorans]SNX75319.1 hypothetical protein SAMN05877753_111154 [Bacillus oleivorans]
MNLGEAKRKALSLMAEYSVDGVPIPDGENADYLNRMNRFADMAQKELATIKKIHASYPIAHNPIKPQQGLLKGFDLIQYLPGTDIIDQYPGSKAYYFEVDGVADVYIEENVAGVWTPLVTINNTTKGVFTAYKGLINASNPNNMIRLRFSGPYVYNLRNKALFAYSFPTADDVPIYRPYIRYEMPADFMELNKVIHETDPRAYKELVEYYWEGKRTFVLNYYLNGSFLIQYYRYPTTIDSTTPDTYEFEVDTEAQEAIPYYMASKAIFDENQTMATQLLNEYQVKLSRLTTDDNYGIQTISQLYVL